MEKNKQVREYFDLPNTEEVFYEYVCSLAIVQGRMYVTEQYICFSASVIGFESKVSPFC